MTVSLRCGCAFFLEKLAIIKCCLSLPESVARQFVWGEDEGLSEARGETAAGVYGVSESSGGVWDAVCEG